MDRIWFNQKGSVLIENKAIMIFSVLLVLGTGAMMIPWLSDYFGLVSEAVDNAGINTGFRSVIWR